jgi:hypothetical protein
LQGSSYAFVPEQSPPLLNQSVKKAKEQPSRLLALCLSPLTKALQPFFFYATQTIELQTEKKV